MILILFCISSLHYCSFVLSRVGSEIQQMCLYVVSTVCQRKPGIMKCPDSKPPTKRNKRKTKDNVVSFLSGHNLRYLLDCVLDVIPQIHHSSDQADTIQLMP